MIKYPVLEIRDEDRLAAEAIARTSGGMTSEIIRLQIRERQEILKLIEAGLDAPICPELTNANPSAPHTVLLEAQAWLLSQLAYRFNLVPEQNFIAFANLFDISQRPATKAQTILKFQKDQSGEKSEIFIGTQVSTSDGNTVFEVMEYLLLSEPREEGFVLAQNLDDGHILLAPNSLTVMVDNVGYVDSVTNSNAIDSGSEIESVTSTLSRVNSYQRRGERLVSTQDIEDAILDEALDGNGIVRAFPFTVEGNFNETRLGYTTVVAMTQTGENLDTIALQNIAEILKQAVGNQFISIVNPFYVEFNISVNVRLKNDRPAGSVLAAIENNLRAFYSPSREQFGRAIYRSEIIAIIEGTAGVDRIIVPNREQILNEPINDRVLQNHELPKLVNVTINVV
ncbi:MAG TPA: baseplate J/gp47 family protein [Pyrinomonadaceae bacterium]|nr:baseplate J/gp47 family protein [Pyrinomonadaceae bacterium]